MKIFTAIVFALACNMSVAGVILEVDVSDPSAVVLNATDAFAESSFGPDTAFLGITLIDFFLGLQTGTAGEMVTSGSLNAIAEGNPTARVPLDFAFFTGFFGGFTPEDLNFYSESQGQTAINFATNQIALTGSITNDFSEVQGFLPSVGTSGDLVYGQPDNNWVIGQWQVIGSQTTVPVPATLALVAIGLAGFGWSKRKRC